MTDQPPMPDPQHPQQYGPAGTGDPATAPRPDQPVTAAATPAVGGPPPVRPAPGAPRGWWHEATSTGGGRAALILAAVFGALLLVVGIGLTAGFVATHLPWNRDGRAAFSRDHAPGMGMGRGRGQENGRGQGGWMGNRQQDDRGGLPDSDLPMGPGAGSGMGRGAGMGLAGVLHGEYTTNATGTPTVMVVQRGQVTAYTAGTSVSVKSSDGFAATYSLAGATATMRNAGQLQTGASVLVVAAKDGMKVTRLVVLG